MKYNIDDYSLGEAMAISKLFDEAFAISCVPDPTKFKKYRENAVIDEDKSVKWNREEIVRRNKVYADEASRLNTIRNHAVHDVEQLVKDLIIDELKYISKGMSDAWYKNAANEIYSRAYTEGHHTSMYEVITYVTEYLDLIESVYGYKEK